MSDDRSGADLRAFSYMHAIGENRTVDFCAGFDDNVVPQNRIAHDCTGTNLDARADNCIGANRRTLIDGRVQADITGLANVCRWFGKRPDA